MIPNKFNGYGADGRRQYHKGGDGGAGEARRQEEERQARINAAVAEINRIFNGGPSKRGVGAVGGINTADRNKTYYDQHGNPVNLVGYVPPDTVVEEREKLDAGGIPPMSADLKLRGMKNTPEHKRIQSMIEAGQLYSGIEEVAGTGGRQQLYEQQKAAVYDINKRDVERQYQEAERDTRFGLARSGLLGGSEDVDANARLQELNNEGLMKATGIADQAAADLKTADERSRQSLISMAQSGIDTGTAQSMALRNLDATAQSAAGARQGASIGNLFGDLGQAYLLRQQRAGMQAGAGSGYQQYGVSSPQQTYSGSRN